MICWKAIQRSSDNPLSEEQQQDVRISRRAPVALLKSICVIAVLTVYICQGALVFSGIEGTNQELQQLNLYLEQIHFNETYQQNFSSDTEFVEWYNRSKRVAHMRCRIAHWNLHSWNNMTYRNALLYSKSIVTTIGWGIFHPTSPTARCITMIYALFGVPLFAALIGYGVQFLGWLERLCMKVKLIRRVIDNPNKLLSLFGIIITALMIIVACEVVARSTNYSPGSAKGKNLTQISHAYPWEKQDGLYFTFTSTLTIGFGDIYLYENDDMKNSRTVMVLQDLVMLAAMSLIIIFVSHCLNKLSQYFDKNMNKKLIRVVHSFNVVRPVAEEIALQEHQPL